MECPRRVARIRMTRDWGQGRGPAADGAQTPAARAGKSVTQLWFSPEQGHHSPELPPTRSGPTNSTSLDGNPPVRARVRNSDGHTDGAHSDTEALHVGCRILKMSCELLRKKE